jgi:hypothetical protein
LTEKLAGHEPLDPPIVRSKKWRVRSDQQSAIENIHRIQKRPPTRSCRHWARNRCSSLIRRKTEMKSAIAESVR